MADENLKQTNDNVSVDEVLPTNEESQTKAPEKKRIIRKAPLVIGIGLLLFQLIPDISALMRGHTLPTISFKNPNLFAFDVMYYIGYNFIAIIGLVMILISLIGKKPK